MRTVTPSATPQGLSLQQLPAQGLSLQQMPIAPGMSYPGPVPQRNTFPFAVVPSPFVAQQPQPLTIESTPAKFYSGAATSPAAIPAPSNSWQPQRGNYPVRFTNPRRYQWKHCSISAIYAASSADSTTKVKYGVNSLPDSISCLHEADADALASAIFHGTSGSFSQSTSGAIVVLLMVCTILELYLKLWFLTIAHIL